jgi:hypothetical protein
MMADMLPPVLGFYKPADQQGLLAFYFLKTIFGYYLPFVMFQAQRRIHNFWFYCCLALAAAGSR